MRDQDEAGAAATQEMVALGSARPGDLVIAGITGGSSALGLPLELISLTDYAALTQLLLGCGANIIEVNAVRKHLAMVGSGRLAKIIHPGVALVNLTVSDVIGDPLVTTLPIRQSRPRRRWQKTIFATNAFTIHMDGSRLLIGFCLDCQWRKPYPKHRTPKKSRSILA